MFGTQAPGRSLSTSYKLDATKRGMCLATYCSSIASTSTNHHTVLLLAIHLALSHISGDRLFITFPIFPQPLSHFLKPLVSNSYPLLVFKSFLPRLATRFRDSICAGQRSLVLILRAARRREDGCWAGVVDVQRDALWIIERCGRADLPDVGLE